ncbi:MAG: alpha-galactosidase [Thermomicrobiales bacterium]
MATTEELARSSGLVATRSAFASDDAMRWTIATDRLRYILEWRDGTLSIARIESADGSVRFDGAGQRAFEISLHTSDGPMPLDGLRYLDSDAEIEGDAVHLTIQLHAQGDSGEVEIAVHVRCHARHSIVEQWIEVTPSRPVTVCGVTPIVLVARATGEVTLHTVAGVQRQGGWQAESGPYRSFRLESRTLGPTIRLESGPRSTWSEMPWAALSQPADAGGLVLALAYGGRWAMVAEANESRESFSARFTPVGLEPEVSANSTWRSPCAWLGVFPSDLDSAAAIMHAYLRDVVIPPLPADFPWVQYNTWFSYYCELDAATLLREAEFAASLGVEVFYVDAGWWAGNPGRRDQFSSGLGNWTENREKFPAGLAHFAGQVRELGMHFGIWFEPERADLRTTTTASWQPEWIATHGDSWVRCDWPADTETVWLCFGSAEVQDWATEVVGRIIAETGARWLKWDSNYWGVCTSPHHGHGTGEGEYAQLQGVYRVMDRLRERFPDLIIENCAGGGTRMDLEIASHTHVAWMSDASEPQHRSRFHAAGASYIYPPEMLNAWVTESRYENLNRQVLPEAIVRATIRSRMLGALGFSCQLAEWSDETRRIMREEVARYKVMVRPLLRHGSVQHLLPQPLLESPRLPAPDAWEAYAFVAADRREAVAFAFRNASPSATLPLRFKDLVPDRSYDIQVESAAAGTYTGEELCTSGIQVSCAPLASVIVTVSATS